MAEHSPHAALSPPKGRHLARRHFRAAARVLTLVGVLAWAAFSGAASATEPVFGTGHSEDAPPDKPADTGSEARPPPSQAFDWRALWLRGLVIGGVAVLAGGAAALITWRRFKSHLDRLERDRQATELQARLALVLETTPDAVELSTPTGQVFYRNESARGLSAPPVTEHPAGDIWQGETVLRRADGQEAPASRVVLAHRGADGGIAFYASIARDLSGRKQAEEALRASEDRFRALVEHGQEGTNIVGERGEVLYSSPVNAPLLGYLPEEIAGRNAFSFAHPEDAPALQGLLATVLRNPRQVFPLTCRLEHKDGNWRWVEGKACNLLHHPAVRGVVVNWHDVTERRRAEKALQQRLSELTVLHRIGVICSVAKSEDELLHRATALIAECLFPDNCGVLLLDAARGTLVHHPSFITTAPDSTPDVPLGKGIAGHVASTGELVRLGDVSQEPAYLALDAGMRSELCVPIKIGAKTVGVIDAESRNRDAFSATDEQLLGTIGDLVGNAMERLRAAVDLRASEQRYASLVNHLDGIVWEVDARTFQFRFVSAQAERILGYPVSRWLHEPEFWVKHIHPGDRDRAVKYCLDCSRRGVDHEFEYRMLAADGRAVWLHDVVSVEVAGGEAVTLRGVMVDITARKQAEEALQDARDFLQLVVDTSPSMIFVLNDRDRAVFVNRATAEYYGTTPEQMLATPADYAHCNEPEVRRFSEDNREVLRTGRRLDREELNTAPDGQPHWFHTVKVRLPRPDGSVGVLAIATDITERKRAEEASRALSAFRETIIRTAAEGICVCSPVPGPPHVRFSVWNDRMTAITGYSVEEINRLGWHQSMYPDEGLRRRAVERMARMYEGDDLRAEEWVITRKDGQRRTVAISTSLVGLEAGAPAVVALLQDVTDRKRAEEERRQLEEQVRHAQKLESLGVLAGGIAHDFNNLLTSVLGYASLAATEVPPTSPALPMLQEIEKAAHRAADLTRQMLAYSGRGKFLTQRLYLDRIVREMGAIVLTVVSKNAVVHQHLGLAPVEGDPSQVRQVVLNLITNASEALGEQPGAITVRTGVCHLEAGSVRTPQLSRELPGGQYSYLEVQDTGCGMDEETLGKVFDPFFTTKFTGRGLGLAAVLGIVRGHQGTIQVESAPGQGTTFRAFFPVPEVADASPPPPLAAPPVGQGTVLVVEDEESVRSYARRVLTGAGFQVLDAGSGPEGLELFSRHLDAVRAVVLDLTMPGMDGWEVAGRLLALSPGVPILVVSGHSESEAGGLHSGIPVAAFLQKPYRPNDLIERVSQIARAPAPGA